MYSVSESMRSADAADEDDDEGSEWVLVSLINRILGRQMSTWRQRSESVGSWFRARAEEIHHAAKDLKMPPPLVLVLVHSPSDVMACGLPVQS